METGTWVHFKMQNGSVHDAIGATVTRHEGGVLILETGEAEELRFRETASGEWRMLHEQPAGHWQAHETGPVYRIS